MTSKEIEAITNAIDKELTNFEKRHNKRLENN